MLVIFSACQDFELVGVKSPIKAKNEGIQIAQKILIKKCKKLPHEVVPTFTAPRSILAS